MAIVLYIPSYYLGILVFFLLGLGSVAGALLLPKTLLLHNVPVLGREQRVRPYGCICTRSVRLGNFREEQKPLPSCGTYHPAESYPTCTFPHFFPLNPSPVSKSLLYLRSANFR